MSKLVSKILKSNSTKKALIMLPVFIFVGFFVGLFIGMYSVNYAPACENRVYEFTCSEGSVNVEDCVEVQNGCTGYQAFEFLGLIGWEGRSAFGAFLGILGSILVYFGTCIWIFRK